MLDVRAVGAGDPHVARDRVKKLVPCGERVDTNSVGRGCLSPAVGLGSVGCRFSHCGVV